MATANQIKLAERELKNTATPAERVQELFSEWWPRRTGPATLQGKVYALPVKSIEEEERESKGLMGGLFRTSGLIYRPLRSVKVPVEHIGVLHFPKEKLAVSQVELLNASLAECSTPISKADDELKSPRTLAERVQELFQEWWPRRIGPATLQGEVYALPVKCIEKRFFMSGFVWQPPAEWSGVLHFSKGKLTEEQIRLLEACLAANTRADDLILQAAKQVAAMDLQSDTTWRPCVRAMIKQLSRIYGYEITEAETKELEGLARQEMAKTKPSSLAPALKVHRAAGITYAIGKVANAYFASGMTLASEKQKEIYASARHDADAIDWPQLCGEARKQ